MSEMARVSQKILGLDLGTSSIGWALFTGENGIPDDLLGLGVRHFQEVVTPKTKEVKNAKRRQMRSLRRNLSRRRVRKDAVLAALRDLGIIGPTEEPFAESESGRRHAGWAPYEYRARALDGPLSSSELARALYHLAQRRGFKSNRGAKLAAIADDPEVKELLAQDYEPDETGKTASAEEKSDSEILEEIKGLANALDGRTLGQYFYEQLLANKRVRTIHTDRSMYEDEFERIMDVQKRYHPALQSDSNRVKLHRALFFQRPLRAQEFLRGNCSLEPSKKRGFKATLVAQRFRAWSDLANLELTDNATGERRRLTIEERRAAAEILEKQKELSWAALRKIVGVKQSSFNLERVKKNDLPGINTAVTLRRIIGERFDQLSDEHQENLVETMLTTRDRGDLYRTLRKTYGYEPAVSYKLAVIDLEPGMASLSARAMRRMLGFMQEGLSRHEAQEAAGYKPWEDETEIEARLPSAPGRLEVTSPRVRKCLAQLRKVVNELIAIHGPIDIIRLEMTREMSLNKKEKLEWEKAGKDRQKENDQATKSLQAIGIEHPTRADKIWYRLAAQCAWQDPYSGDQISVSIDGMRRFQIEHIVPYSICFDDSFNNLTLCRSDYNLRKGNQTPFQAFGHTTEWPAMAERIRRLKGFGAGKKTRLFLREEAPDVDKMANRQLTETGWITRSAKDYLAKICPQVEVTKGSATAMLRDHWGIMSALFEDGNKSRDDLRHHAADAATIAFTTRSMFQRISRSRKQHADATDAKIAPLSKDTVPEAPVWLVPRLKEAFAEMVVSHETTRGILGAFHEETIYGRRPDGTYQVRKPLVSLNEKEIERVIDPELRQALIKAWKESGKPIKEVFANGFPFRGTTVRRVRIEAFYKSLNPLNAEQTKWVNYGNNHHVEIFRSLDGKKQIGRFVTTIEAARRVRREKKPLVDTNAPVGFEFVMWLCNNDTVRTEDNCLWRVQKLDPTNDVLTFRALNAAGVRNDAERLFKSSNTFRGIKLEISPTGKVREVPEGRV